MDRQVAQVRVNKFTSYSLAIAHYFYCFLRFGSPRQQHTVSHSHLLASSHVDNFGFICPSLRMVNINVLVVLKALKK